MSVSSDCRLEMRDGHNGFLKMGEECEMIISTTIMILGRGDGIRVYFKSYERSLSSFPPFLTSALDGGGFAWWLCCSSRVSTISGEGGAASSSVLDGLVEANELLTIHKSLNAICGPLFGQCDRRKKDRRFVSYFDHQTWILDDDGDDNSVQVQQMKDPTKESHSTSEISNIAILLRTGGRRASFLLDKAQTVASLFPSLSG